MSKCIAPVTEYRDTLRARQWAVVEWVHEIIAGRFPGMELEVLGRGQYTARALDLEAVVRRITVSGGTITVVLADADSDLGYRLLEAHVRNPENVEEVFDALEGVRL